MWLSMALAGCSYPSVIYPDGPLYPIVEPAGVDVDIVVDEIVQDPSRSVDLLIAVDPALASDLADALPSLIALLGEVPADAWRIGFVSTALGDPETAGIIVGEPIRPGDPVEIPALSDVGPYGGLGAALLALEPGTNPRFGGAEVVHVLVVTAHAEEPGPVTLPERLAVWDDAHPDVGLSVIAPSDMDDLAPVADLALDLGEPLDASLEAVGRLAAGLETEFFLTERPAPGSLAVEVQIAIGDSVLQAGFEPEEWRYDAARNSVRFQQFLPPAGAVVRFVYDPLGCDAVE